jgi:hypothetical protein
MILMIPYNFFPIIAGFVGFGLMWAGYRRFQLKQWVQDLPTSRIGTAAQGLIEVQGHATAYRGKIFASHTGRSSVYLRCHIEEWQSGRKSGWKTIHSSTHGEEFLVTDSSGIAHVHLFGANIVLNRETHESVSNETELTVEGFYGFPRFSKGRRYRIHEEKILVGEPVTVIGDFRAVDLDSDLKLSGGFRKSRAHPFLISDNHQDALLKKLSYGVPGMILGATMVSFSLWWFLTWGRVVR